MSKGSLKTRFGRRGFRVLAVSAAICLPILHGAPIRAGDGDSELKRMMDERRKKLDAATDGKKKDADKERAERERRIKEDAEIKKMMDERRKRVEKKGDVGKLTEEEMKKIRGASRAMREKRGKEDKEEPETGDEKAEANADKFDGDIDIDPEDEWDEDPECLTGD
jgi:hypothetical protein